MARNGIKHAHYKTSLIDGVASVDKTGNVLAIYLAFAWLFTLRCRYLGYK
jgi:hypothetical protein